LKYFVSDTHFNHNNIIKYCDRPFDSVEEMNEVLIKNWNSVVSEGDIVYFLGDFSMSLGAVEELTKRLNGHKKLITGNHDSCFSGHRMSRKVDKALEVKQKYYTAGWRSIDSVTTTSVCGVEVNLNHFPYKKIKDSDRHDKRYDKYRIEDNGLWLLHGHVHSSSQTMLDKRMIDVGVDCNNYTPVSEDRIKEIIDENS